MTASSNSIADRRAEILQSFKEHKLTSAQACEEIKKLEAEFRRIKKKSGGKKK